jgi:hypothetical protein
MYEKNEIDKKLIIRIKQLEKSNKDQEIMEKYYEQKWVSEFNTVKKKL